MKDLLFDLVRDAADALAARNRVREYLQARILQCLQRGGAMIPLAFHGGTALRFLFGIPRFSEDLDFALERPDRGFDFHTQLRRVRKTLHAEGYSVTLRVKDERIVHSALVRFGGLLHALDLSPRPEEVLSIKLEVDSQPPAGAGLATTLIRRHVTLQLQHHDRASLLAGKCHAVLQREYTKGRDLYDLLWYLGDPDWPAPNLTLLGRALDQSGWTGPAPGPDNWRSLLAEKIARLDWDRVTDDVGPFLEDPEELRLLTRPNLLGLLSAAPTR